MSAVQQLLTEHLAIWTDADTAKRSGRGRSSGNAASVYGVKKLRELILELAVRGKLVPQDANDEPASELLKRIQVEKAKLIAKGKINKEKPLTPITDDEKSFDLPRGWVFVKLGDVAYSQAGFAFKSNCFNDLGLGLPLIRIRDVGQAFTGTYFDGDYRDEFVVKKGDYLISMDGEFRVAKWLNNNALLNQRVSRLIFFTSDVGKRFIAESLQARLKELQGVKAYTTVDHLSGGQISNSIIALPPVQEQHRIVAKVDELMALCDQLETQHNNAAEAHEKIVSVLLGRLTQSADAEQFTENWQRIAAHFDTLFTTEASIDALKQTLLQLAVMGKLVPQDANDEPASQLLQRIQAEKAKLVAAGKIKKDKPLAPIGDEEKPFDLPIGWKVVRVGDLINLISGQHLKPDEYSEKELKNGVPYITGPAEFGMEFPTYSKFTNEKRALAKNGDILITCKGSGIGKINSSNMTMAISRQLMSIQPILMDVGYVKRFINSKYEYFQSKGVGIAIPGISREDILDLIFPTPPLEEQHRIVAKVDELMAICDQLKTRITAANQLQQKLADVVVENALL